jgi:hypothetical protein
MWLCIGLLFAVIAAAWLAAGARRSLPSASRDGDGATAEPTKPPRAALDGALLTLRSSYLLSIVAIVGLYELVWSQFVCNDAKVDCSQPDGVPDALAACCDASVPKTIQERAWSSPIWYGPSGS